MTDARNRVRLKVARLFTRLLQLFIFFKCNTMPAQKSDIVLAEYLISHLLRILV